MFRFTRAWLPMLAAISGLLVVAQARAADAPAMLRIGYLGETVERPILPDYVDAVPADEGLQGAKLAIADNQTTGRFIGQNFVLDEAVTPTGGDVAEAARQLIVKGDKLIVANLSAPSLLKVAKLADAAHVTLFNAGAPDDDLRAENCQRAILHTIPSRAMAADALMQYLLAKRWRQIFLVVGPTPADQAYAAAIRQSARKFQMKFAADKPWTYDPGARRTDTGHYDVLSEVTRFTQGIDYDVMIVADEEQQFGYELAYRAEKPRPVAGTIGLVPTAWGRPHEQWGATQLQQRFKKQTGRWMTGTDYAAWVGVRSVGEAAAQTKSTDPDALAAFIRSDKFEMGAYKGAKMTYRAWDGQLRQPILLIDAYSLVSVSPQPGFLHQFSELDTLGVDKPETKCVFK